MKKTSLIILLFIFINFSCKNEKIKILGRVLDYKTNNLIPEAIVGLACVVYDGLINLNFAGNYHGEIVGEVEVYTDINGNFSLKVVSHCDNAYFKVSKQEYFTYNNSDFEFEKDKIVLVKMTT